MMGGYLWTLLSDMPIAMAFKKVSLAQLPARQVKSESMFSTRMIVQLRDFVVIQPRRIGKVMMLDSLLTFVTLSL